MTPFQDAASLLLKAGADFKIKNSDGQTPGMLAGLRTVAARHISEYPQRRWVELKWHRCSPS
jgi:hypothetical protein